MPTVLLIKSNTHNPWNNLALEELLFKRLAAAGQTDLADSDRLGAILYLWQNDQTVVIGRNQNAWAECNTAQLEADGGFLARRTTGGGAVFHDLGNLCFSILLPQAAFNLDRNFQIITDALNAEGIPAIRSGRNDILVNGAKFSGNAFRLNNGVGLHHGTVLVHSEFTRLSRYLTVDAAKLKAKGIASVRARVINLVEVKPDVTVPHLEQTLETAFLTAFCADNGWAVARETDADHLADPEYQALCQRFASWEWRYGATLPFDAQVSERFEWGQVQVGFTVKHGHVEQAQVWSDALDADFLEMVAAALKGAAFQSEALARAIGSIATCDSPFGGCTRQTMADELKSLLLAQGW